MSDETAAQAVTEAAAAETEPQRTLLPLGVTANKRAVMVNGELVEMPEKDQLPIHRTPVPEQ